MNQNENALTVTDMPPMPTWMASINRFECAVIAKSWAGAGHLEEVPAIDQEYSEARIELIGQFRILNKS